MDPAIDNAALMLVRIGTANVFSTLSILDVFEAFMFCVRRQKEEVKLSAATVTDPNATVRGLKCNQFCVTPAIHMDFEIFFLGRNKIDGIDIS